MNLPRTLLPLILIGPASLAPLSAQNLLANGDFENGKVGLAIFAPGGAKECNPQLEVGGGGRDGGHAGEMSCSAPARFAITHFLKKGSFAPNQRMRISAWIKAGGFSRVGDARILRARSHVRRWKWR